MQPARVSGDPRAGAPSPLFRDLFDRELSYVWTSLRRLGVPERDREDLANEVFFRVYQRLSDYDPGKPARPWLFAFAARVASEYWRRAVHRLEELGGGEDAAAAAVIAPGVRTDESELVHLALDELDMDKRAVLILHDLDGYSAPEIARALQVPEGTVYSRLRAARTEFTAAVRKLDRRRR